MNTLKLSGVTSASGGTYENVIIEGVAKINGDITCNDMDIQGVSTFSGNIDCERLSLEGTCKVAGNIDSKECVLAGLLTIEGSMQAENFTGSGSFRIEKGLNAETVDVKFVHGSGTSEVCGRAITIRKERQNGATEFIMDLIPWRHKGKNFGCELIEGDEIDIEYVEADIVRGTLVKIGPDCKINLVEYHEQISIDQSAKVAKTVKIGD